MIKYNKKYALYGVIILIFMVIHYIVLNNATFTLGDDTDFKKMAMDYNFFDFISKRYTSWSGRVIIEGFLYVLIGKDNGLTLWKLISLVFYFIYIASASLTVKTIIGGSLKVRHYCFIIFLIAIWPYLIYYPVFNSGLTWFTGSFNYFFPFAFACVVLLFLVKKVNGRQVNKWFYGLVIISALYASNQEQISLLLGTLMILLTAYQYLIKKRVDIAWWLILVILIGGLLIVMLAPGNELRYVAGLSRFKEVDFASVEPEYKLLLGIGYTTYFQLLKSSFLLLLISIPLLSIALVKKNISLVFFCLIILAYLAVVTYVLLGISPFTGNHQYIWQLIESYSLPYEVSTLLFILSIVLLLIPYCIFLSFESKQKSLFIALLFVGGMCTGFMLGFSPTIVFSGFRIFFVSVMILSVIVASLYLEFFRVSKSRVVNIIVVSLSFIIIVLYAIGNIKKGLEQFTIYHF